MAHVSESPPFHPGRSDFPRPVGDLDHLIFSPIGSSRSPRSLSANSHTPLTCSVYPTARHLHEIPPGLSRLISLDAHQDREPLCPLRIQGVLLSSPHRKALPFPLRSYGLMRQTKILLSASHSTIPKGLCRLPLAPAGSWPFPTLSPRSLHRCLDPYPVALLWCTHPFLPSGLRPYPDSERFGTLVSLHCNFNRGIISRLQSFLYVQAPMLVRPQIAPTDVIF